MNILNRAKNIKLNLKKTLNKNEPTTWVGVRRVDAQTWSFVLLCKFNVGCQFCAPKLVRKPSPKTLSNLIDNLSVFNKKKIYGQFN